MRRERLTAPTTRHSVACATHIGRTHRKNQDSGGAWTWQRPDGSAVSLAVVADGVSSGPTSELASRLAVETVRASIAPIASDPEIDLDGLLAALVAAARRASEEIAGEAAFSTTADATTLAALCCRGRDVAGVWAGDSRVYRVSGREAQLLTRDHSWAEGVVSQGLMTAEQAERDPRAHAITRWLGPQGGGESALDTFRLTLKPGDIVLCCSDGLYGYFGPPLGTPAEMAETLGRPGSDLRSGLDRLVERALQRGGHDDITGAAIQVLGS
jgi:serine/threonine protein phosphatase PrpC